MSNPGVAAAVLQAAERFWHDEHFDELRIRVDKYGRLRLCWSGPGCGRGGLIECALPERTLREHTDAEEKKVQFELLVKPGVIPVSSRIPWKRRRTQCGVGSHDDLVGLSHVCHKRLEQL